ncbi:MAG: SpaH/EbpB family LPXTG-anchored major pilin, partial [Clostridiales bacterium]|nr:SpaH/EbpB family LPXTG-anchored major pilin [Clostridiales bacterium]
MSKLKKFAGILLALVMCFGLTCTAFAAGETITVTNANVGETYEAYLVFTATTNGTNNTYYITSTSPYFEYIDPSQASDSPFTLVETGTSGTYQVTFTNGEAAAAYIVSIGAKGSAVVSVKATSETAVLTVNQAGYYFVTTTTGSAVSTDATTGNVDITDKNSEPTVDKEETTDGTAGIGDKVEYKATIAAAEDVTALVYHDTMSNGLTFNNDVAIDGMTVNEDYTVSTSCSDGCTFEVTFTATGLAKITSATQKVVITYSATVNANAVTVDALTNEATLSYGDNGTSAESKTSTYTYDISIFKYTGTDTPLADAKFQLSKTENGTTYYAVIDNKGVLSSWTNDSSAATTLVSGTDGKISVDGLDAGTYTLTETEAPAGYNQLTSAITVVIADDDKDGTATVTYTYNGTESNGEIKVLNNAGSVLPGTGGIGTTIFYVVGGVLVVGAVV